MAWGKPLEAFAFRRGSNHFEMPTRAGKTIVMAEILRRVGKKALLLAHRQELLDQAREKISMVAPELTTSFWSGKEKDASGDVVLGSVQACFRKNALEHLQKQGFKVLLIDEAHHATAKSYRKVINHLGFSSYEDKDKDKFLVGVTATAYRGDGISLDEVFPCKAFSIPVKELVKDGYLIPAVGRRILTTTSIENVSNTSGDFSVGELSETINTHKRNDLIVRKFSEIAPKRKTVAFCVDVEHTKNLATAFQQKGFTATAIYGAMNRDDRSEALAAFGRGDVQVLTSCAVLTEGFDEPSIECILMTRPTRSYTLYKQCVGRGLRIYPGKEDCLILDFTDEVSQQKERRQKRDVKNIKKVLGVTTEEEKEEEKEERKLHLKRKVDEDFSLFVDLGEHCWLKNFGFQTRYTWFEIDDNFFSISSDSGIEVVVFKKNDRWIAVCYDKDNRVLGALFDDERLEDIVYKTEKFMGEELSMDLKLLEGGFLSSKDEATKGQKKFLKKCNAWDHKLTKAQASCKISWVIAEQRHVKRYGAKVV